jgi:hypothetical protein
MIALTTACGGGVTGYQIVQNRVLVPVGATQQVNVSCPPGKKVLGGGFSIETPDDMKVFNSEPSDGNGNLSDTRWNVMVTNAGQVGARQTTAIAICADAQ